MTKLSLSKYADPVDFPELAEELAVVDQYFTAARPQHPMRRWEYAMALRAIDTWQTQRVNESLRPVYRYADVGGAGSPFYRMTGSDQTVVIDPDDGGLTLADWVAASSKTFSIVTCLSVVEHLPQADLDRFCYHLSCLTAPGGLLVLTCDAVDHAITGDQYHFHWMRQQIFDRPALLRLRSAFVDRYHFTDLGGVDYHYPGPQVFDYSFASLALVKRS